MDQKKCEVEFDGSIPDVYAETLTLLEEIWKADIKAICICQGIQESDKMWIKFTSLSEVLEFLRIVGQNKNNGNSLENHLIVLGKINRKCNFQATDLSESNPEDQLSLDSGTCISIPKSDYNEVLASFKYYNN